MVVYTLWERMVRVRFSALRNMSPKIIVVLPAYNAQNTLRQTVADIPRDLVGEIILVDDFSKDETLSLAKDLHLTTFSHPQNLGYGANQKLVMIWRWSMVPILLLCYIRIINTIPNLLNILSVILRTAILM